jgi:hypothetical protein
MTDQQLTAYRSVGDCLRGAGFSFFFRFNHLFPGMSHYTRNITCFVLSSTLFKFLCHTLNRLDLPYTCYWFCLVRLLVWFFWCICAFINPQS